MLILNIAQELNNNLEKMKQRNEIGLRKRRVNSEI